MSSKNASALITAAFEKMPGETRTLVTAVRDLIHKTAPTIEEGWKWGPCFQKNSLIMGLWGFKKHVSVVFYRGAEMSDRHKLFNDGFDNAHNRMVKLFSKSDLDAKKLADYIREAVKLDAAEKKPFHAAGNRAAKTVAIPEELSKWFEKNKKAKQFFDSIAFTFKKEMVQHISGAKQYETRLRRFKQVTEALKKGKKEFR